MHETRRDDRDLGTRHEYHGLQPVLPVRDVAATVRYYCETLGFEFDFTEGDPPVHARVFKGDRTFGDPVYIHFRKAAGEGETWAGELRIHVGSDVDGLAAALRERGVDLHEGPVTQPWGLRELLIRDCNGVALRFCGYAAAGPLA